MKFFLNFYRFIYYLLFIMKCENCGHNFFYVYLSLSYINCPFCNQKFCIYCLRISHDENSESCLYRYTVLYILGLLGLLTLYLKLVFVFNNFYLTRYFIVFFVILEYIVFNNKIDNIITTFLNIKNIILGIVMVIYYDEKDIIILIIVSMIQLIIILQINLFKNILINSIRNIIKDKFKYIL